MTISNLCCSCCPSNIQELKPKPGDLKAKVLENMALVASKNKHNVETAINAFMEICSNEVSWGVEGVGWGGGGLHGHHC